MDKQVERKFISMWNESYQTHWVTLIANPQEGWTLRSDGFVADRECSVSEVENLIECLTQEEWILVGSVDHRAWDGDPFTRDLYFRRTLVQESPGGSAGYVWVFPCRRVRSGSPSCVGSRG